MLYMACCTKINQQMYTRSRMFSTYSCITVCICLFDNKESVLIDIEQCVCVTYLRMMLDLDVKLLVMIGINRGTCVYCNKETIV